MNSAWIIEGVTITPMFLRVGPIAWTSDRDSAARWATEDGALMIITTLLDGKGRAVPL